MGKTVALTYTLFRLHTLQLFRLLASNETSGHNGNETIIETGNQTSTFVNETNSGSGNQTLDDNPGPSLIEEDTSDTFSGGTIAVLCVVSVLISSLIAVLVVKRVKRHYNSSVRRNLSRIAHDFSSYSSKTGSTNLSDRYALRTQNIYDHHHSLAKSFFSSQKSQASRSSVMNSTYCSEASDAGSRLSSTVDSDNESQSSDSSINTKDSIYAPADLEKYDIGRKRFNTNSSNPIPDPDQSPTLQRNDSYILPLEPFSTDGRSFDHPMRADFMDLYEYNDLSKVLEDQDNSNKRYLDLDL